MIGKQGVFIADLHTGNIALGRFRNWSPKFTPLRRASLVQFPPTGALVNVPRTLKVGLPDIDLTMPQPSYFTSVLHPVLS
jgi:hypothetical protein